MLSGCVLWLRADMGITKDGSDRVSVWADQSGNGHDFAQSTGTAQPAITTYNGIAAILFDPAVTIRYLTRAHTAAMNTAAQSQFMVYRAKAATTNYQSLGVTHITTPGNNYLDWYTRLTTAPCSKAGSAGTVVDGAGRMRLWHFTAPASGNGTAGYNGTGYNTGAQSAHTGSAAHIIGSRDSDFFTKTDGHVFEVAQYNRELTAGELASWVTYATARYGALT